MRCLTAALVILAVVVTRPSNADACLNGVIMYEEEAVQKLALAERALERGQYRRVLRLLDADHYEAPPRVVREIHTIQAVSRLRLGKRKSAERYFRRRLRARKDDPFLLTRLAEALAPRKGDAPIEAWKILDDLEKRDLIPDAEGYATLARLRERAGDAEGFARAANRCRAMTRNPASCPALREVARH